MKKKVYFIINLIILIIMLIPNLVNAFELSATPVEVKSGKDFTFKLNMADDIYLANGHLVYDPDLFTYKSVNTQNLKVEQISEGEIAWVYTDYENNPKGVQDLEFVFTASSLIYDTKTKIDVIDDIYINTKEEIYESLDFSKEITILGRYVVVVPVTGGIGTLVFIIPGCILIYISIKLIKKNRAPRK